MGCSKGMPSLQDTTRHSLAKASQSPQARIPFQPVPLPQSIPNPLPAFLEALFKPGENIAVARACPRPGQSSGEKSWKPNRSKTFKYGESLCLNHLSTHQFFRVNPMSPSGTRDADVAAYRQVLIEMDADDQGQQIPLDVQFGALLASQLPIASIVYSGNKSLHAIVRVDATTLVEFDQRKAIAHAKINRFVRSDQRVGNPSRLSRLPGAIRNVQAPGQSPEQKEQALLALNVGPPSWAEYDKLHPEDNPSLEESCYTAPQQQSSIAIQQISKSAIKNNHVCSSVCGLLEYQKYLPKDVESHNSIHEGKGNCLWRLCRLILRIAKSNSLKTEDHLHIFEHWYQVYVGWTLKHSVQHYPWSRLKGIFLMTAAKCKIPEGESTLQVAWENAKNAEFPPETESFQDDPETCRFVAFLREVAILRDKGGVFFISVRDIAEVTGLFDHMTAHRRLRLLEQLGILTRLHAGNPGIKGGKAATYVYRPINEPF